METKKDIIPFDINSFFGQNCLERAIELSDKLNDKFLTGRDLEIDLKLLYEWTKCFNERKQLDGRTKYSFVDYIWYKMVEQFRKAGLSFPILISLRNQILEEIEVKGIITKINQAKTYIDTLDLSKSEKEELRKYILSAKIDNLKNETFTLLQVIIMECVLKRLPLSIAVFLDGSYMILDKAKEHLYSEEEKDKLLFETYTTVSISTIIKKFLHSKLAGFIVPKFGLYSYAENKLFEVVHSGEYEKICIHFKDKNIKSLHLTKSENVKEKILDILGKDEYGEIVVKKHKGIVTRIENTIKIVL